MNVFVQIRTNPDFQPEVLEDISILSNDNHTLLQEAIVWRPEFAEFFTKMVRQSITKMTKDRPRFNIQSPDLIIKSLFRCSKREQIQI